MANAVSSIVSEDWPISLRPSARSASCRRRRAMGRREDGRADLGPAAGRLAGVSEESSRRPSSTAPEAQGGGLLHGDHDAPHGARADLQFILPPWLLFVVRAVITLDGSTAWTGSALAAAAPRRAALSPRTPQGEARLRAALLTSDNGLGVDRLKKLASSAGDAGDAPDVGAVVKAPARGRRRRARGVAYGDARPALRAARRAAVAAAAKPLTPELRETLPRRLPPRPEAAAGAPRRRRPLGGDAAFFEPRRSRRAAAARLAPAARRAAARIQAPSRPRAVAARARGRGRPGGGGGDRRGAGGGSGDRPVVATTRRRRCGVFRVRQVRLAGTGDGVRHAPWA